MSNLQLTLTALGGLGNIGANMQLIESPSSRVLIDCGILFPKDEHFGLRFLIPDFYSALKEKNVDALIITHGHEDHIGAITFMAKHFSGITVYAPPFAAALIRRKTEEHNLSLNVVTYDHQSILGFVDFDIYPLEVLHSIPQTYGLVIKDKFKNFALAYLSDFKLDKQHKLITNLQQQLSDCRKRFLLCDSTNILNNTEPLDEPDLVSSLRQAFSKSKGRIFLTCFSSNIYRLQAIFDLAAEKGKYVVPHGRSMLFYINVALEMGLLTDSQNRLRLSEQIDTQDNRLIVLLSGCQGEFRGTLRRVAFLEDSTFKPTSSDQFIFSSKTIPGNEFPISQIYNQLAKNQIEVITASDTSIHASGHISWSGLSSIYQAIKPDVIVPVHGETFFLKRHIEKVRNEFKSSEALMLTNGDSLKFFDDASYLVEPGIEHDPLFIHGSDIVIEKAALSERRKMSSEGLISVAINLDSVHRRHPKIDIEVMGVPQLVRDQLPEFEIFMLSYLKTLKITDKVKAQEEVRVAVRRYFMPLLGYRPLAIIHLH